MTAAEIAGRDRWIAALVSALVLVRHMTPADARQKANEEWQRLWELDRKIKQGGKYVGSKQKSE